MYSLGDVFDAGERGIENFVDLMGPENIFLGLILVGFFWLFIKALSKLDLFKDDSGGPNQSIIGVISFVLSLLITYFVNKSGVSSSINLSDIFDYLGYSDGIFPTLLSLLVFGAVIYMLVKIGYWFFILGGIIMFVISFTELIYSTLAGAVFGVILFVIGIFWRRVKKGKDEFKKMRLENSGKPKWGIFNRLGSRNKLRTENERGFFRKQRPFRKVSFLSERQMRKQRENQIKFQQKEAEKRMSNAENLQMESKKEREKRENEIEKQKKLLEDQIIKQREIEEEAYKENVKKEERRKAEEIKQLEYKKEQIRIEAEKKKQELKLIEYKKEREKQKAIEANNSNEIERLERQLSKVKALVIKMDSKGETEKSMRLRKKALELRKQLSRLRKN